MRIVESDVSAKGFRTRHIKSYTTLPDEKTHPGEAPIALHMRRWKIELYFRDIKASPGLDVARRQSPAMVEQETYMQAIACSMVRGAPLCSKQP